MDTRRALMDVQAERRRQMDVEGWTPDHDDTHGGGEMLLAAMTYLWWGTDSQAPLRDDGTPMGWPWDAAWWKPKTRRENLVRAGGLCLAEKERMERAGRQVVHVQHKLDIVLREMGILDGERVLQDA